MHDQERELYRKARVARFRKERWGDFWSQVQEEVHRQFPSRAERARVVDAMQCIVTLGVGEPIEELPAGATAT